MYVLPKDVEATPNGSQNGPLNVDAVEVYGAVSGQLGWTEEYGWKHKGPWVQDFEKLVTSFKLEKEQKERRAEDATEDAEKARRECVQKLLDDYKEST